MKKLFVKRMIMMLALALSLTLLTSCGGAGKPSSSGTSAGSGSEAAQSQEKPELTPENILEYPETPEDQFTYTPHGDGVGIYACDSEDDVVVVPAFIDGNPVVAIESNSMAMLPARAVVLPDSVTYVGMAAFCLSKQLMYVHLGSGLKTVEELAFNQCESLKEVVFPEGTETFESYLFAGNYQLRRIVIPASVTSIPKGIGLATDSPDAVVVTPKGSVAEKEALVNGYKVEYSEN